jgi:hypothetical protein
MTLLVMCEPVSVMYPPIWEETWTIGKEYFLQTQNSWIYIYSGHRHNISELHQDHVSFLNDIPNGFSIRVRNFTQRHGNRHRSIIVTANKNSINNLNYETILNHSSCFVRIMLLPHLNYLPESLLFELLRDPHHDIRDAANSHTKVRASAEASPEATNISADTLNLIRKASRFTIMDYATI